MTALSNMTVAGIDPGKTGALAILHSDGSTEFFDVPRIVLDTPFYAPPDWLRPFLPAYEEIFDDCPF